MKTSAIGGFIAGAAFTYFADPGRGRRRRAVVRDKVAAGWRDITNEFDKAGRDFWNRTRGAASGVSSLWTRKNADSIVLEQRVRSAIGRAVSHPHAIRTHVEESGRIVLEGPVLSHELDYLLKRVSSVAGGTEVMSNLEVHSEPGSISSLQGGVPRRRLSELAQQNWTPSLRVASGAVAGAAFYSSIRRDGPFRWASAVAGTALLARAVVNKPFRQIFGLGPGAGAVHFDKTVHINASVEDVYAFWANFENFPKFMTHLKEVRDLKNGRSHWVAAGPAGISIPWDAEITEQRQNELLAWTSVPGSVVRTSGVVRFDKEKDGGARVGIRMSYCPPAGIFGHAVAWLFGADPKSEMNGDLVRLKSLIETGKTRAHGAPVTREQAYPGIAGASSRLQ